MIFKDERGRCEITIGAREGGERDITVRFTTEDGVEKKELTIGDEDGAEIDIDGGVDLERHGRFVVVPTVDSIELSRFMSETIETETYDADE